jgi:hypothetical protein
MKFLFTDGPGSTTEVYSNEELNILINNSIHKERIRIWRYSTSQWISYEEFLKSQNRAEFQSSAATLRNKEEPIGDAPPKKITNLLGIIKMSVVVIGIIGGVFILVYVFFSKEWMDPAPVTAFAERPINSPKVNTDSLIGVIEVTEFRTLEKLTKTNLRLRNNWPDKIVLSLQYDRSQHARDATLFKFINTGINIENLTGYNLDEAVVELKVWKFHEIIRTDTFHFKSIGYTAPSIRYTGQEYQGDSLSVNFHTIRSLDLNFCYSYERPALSGNPNDKWFCKD